MRFGPLIALIIALLAFTIFLTRRNIRVGKRRRLFYCINHPTLLSNEGPLLLKVGYAEIYIPKLLPGEGSGADKFPGRQLVSYDHTLTLSPVDKAVLDAHNFYDDEMTEVVADAVGRNFDIVITSAYHTAVVSFVRKLRLPIGIRVFGLDGAAHYDQWFTPAINSLIIEHRRRVRFLAAYSHLEEVETIFKPLFQYAPITLEPVAGIRARNVTKKAVLFRAPLVYENPYYTAKVNEFLTAFNTSGLDFRMYGTALTIFNHSHNLGRLNPEDMNDAFASYSALYYDSTEPRHLHYHPLEAMQAGMPVIFLKGGMLGRHLQHGLTNSVEDAKDKLRRLIAGDLQLEQTILSEQTHYLDTWRNEPNLKQWRLVLGELGQTLRY